MPGKDLILDYEINHSNTPKIKIYSEKNVDLESIKNLADKLQVKYNDDSVIALARTIDKINIMYQKQKYIKVKEEAKKSLYIENYKQHADQGKKGYNYYLIEYSNKNPATFVLKTIYTSDDIEKEYRDNLPESSKNINRYNTVRNRGITLGTGVTGFLIGAIIGAVLVLTGVFAPLGAGILGAVALGAVMGGCTSFFTGIMGHSYALTTERQLFVAQPKKNIPASSAAAALAAAGLADDGQGHGHGNGQGNGGEASDFTEVRAADVIGHDPLEADFVNSVIEERHQPRVSIRELRLDLKNNQLIDNLAVDQPRGDDDQDSDHSHSNTFE